MTFASVAPIWVAVLVVASGLGGAALLHVQGDPGHGAPIDRTGPATARPGLGRSIDNGSNPVPAPMWTNATGFLEPGNVGPVYSQDVAFDSSQNVTILLSTYGTTWSYRSGTWSNITAEVGRRGFDAGGNMVYDAASHQMVLIAACPTCSLLETTWVLGANARWTALEGPNNASIVPAGALGLYGSTGLVYDPARGAVLAFIGIFPGNNSTAVTEGPGMELVWEFSNDRWTNITPTNGSQPGAFGAWSLVLADNAPNVVYDPAIGCDVVFSPFPGGGPSPAANRTWEFCSSNWTRGPQNPGAFYNASTSNLVSPTQCVYDLSLGGELCVLQTWTEASTWLYANNSWTEVVYNGTPPNYRFAGTGILINQTGGDGEAGFLLWSGLVYDAADETALYLGGWNPEYTGLNGRLAYVLGVSPLFVRLSASPDPGEAGGPVVLTTETVGGAGPFNYSYAGLPAGCDAFDRSSFGCVPEANGTYSIQVTVTDRLGQDALATATLVVGAGLQAQLTVAPDRIELGESADVSLAIRGGLPPYWTGYSGLPAGCTANATGSWVCTPSATGNFTLAAQVLDADGVDAVAQAPLTVLPGPSDPTLTVSSSIADEGVPVTLTARVTGGVAPFAYAYSGLPIGCPAADAPSIVCRGTPPGEYSTTVRITDAFGVAVEASTRWTVATPLSAGLTVPPPPYYVGQPLTVTASAAGGTPPYSIQWGGVPGPLNASGAIATWTPDAAGRFTLTASVTDRGGGAANASVTMTIDVLPTSRAAGPPLGLVAGVAGGGAAVVVAAVAAILFVRRRRTGRS